MAVFPGEPRLPVSPLGPLPPSVLQQKFLRISGTWILMGRVLFLAPNHQCQSAVMERIQRTNPAWPHISSSPTGPLTEGALLHLC